jgi:hypothetical protein
VAPGRELEPGDGIDRHRVDVDAAGVADRHVGAASRQQRADPLAQARQVGACDRSTDLEPDRGGRGDGHQEVDPSPSEKSSALER